MQIARNRIAIVLMQRIKAEHIPAVKLRIRISSMAQAQLMSVYNIKHGNFLEWEKLVKRIPFANFYLPIISFYKSVVVIHTEIHAASHSPIFYPAKIFPRMVLQCNMG